MNLRKRRALACFIDGLFIFGIIVPLNKFLISATNNKFLEALFFGPEFNIFGISIKLPGLIFLMTVVLFSAKDIIFKNAGIGKKIVNLKILTKDDKEPPLRTVFIRGLVVVLGGVIIYDRCRHNGVDIETWELNHLGTKVVVDE